MLILLLCAVVPGGGGGYSAVPNVDVESAKEKSAGERLEAEQEALRKRDKSKKSSGSKEKSSRSKEKSGKSGKDSKRSKEKDGGSKARKHKSKGGKGGNTLTLEDKGAAAQQEVRDRPHLAAPLSCSNLSFVCARFLGSNVVGSPPSFSLAGRGQRWVCWRCG